MKHAIRSNTLSITIAWASAAIIAAPTLAVTVPYTETFNQNAANWYDGQGLAPVNWNAAGGPDATGFVSTQRSFAGLAANDPLVLFRAQDEFNSSGNAFVGDWVAGNVSGFGAAVRHDASLPLNFFVRFAGPNNFPGAANVFFIPVPANTWTDLSAALPNPNLIFEGPLTYAQVFGNVGHVQIGVSVPAGLAGGEGDFHFDLDNVRIVPEPATLALLGVGLVVAGRRMTGRRARS